MKLNPMNVLPSPPLMRCLLPCIACCAYLAIVLCGLANQNCSAQPPPKDEPPPERVRPLAPRHEEKVTDVKNTIQRGVEIWSSRGFLLNAKAQSTQRNAKKNAAGKDHTPVQVLRLRKKLLRLSPRLSFLLCGLCVERFNRRPKAGCQPQKR